jgi:proteasome lid subunit RPN8/RPN11
MLTLPREVYDAVIDHARDGAPEEVCGILGGDHGTDRTRVESVHRAHNAADTPRTAYAIDPGEQLELIDRVEAAGEDLAGFYHSHPAGPSRPSRTDAARAAWPGQSYLLVALDGRHPYVGSWRWEGDAGEFVGEQVRLL